VDSFARQHENEGFFWQKPRFRIERKFSCETVLSGKRVNDEGVRYGVAGFLGSHLADAMLAEGHQVVGVDNLIGGELDNVPSKVDFHQFDCRAATSIIIAPRRRTKAYWFSRLTS
jgi:hypothetical protein